MNCSSCLPRIGIRLQTWTSLIKKKKKKIIQIVDLIAQFSEPRAAENLQEPAVCAQLDLDIGNTSVHCSHLSLSLYVGYGGLRQNI
jgi:hypothetical protein